MRNFLTDRKITLLAALIVGIGGGIMIVYLVDYFTGNSVAAGISGAIWFVVWLVLMVTRR